MNKPFHAYSGDQPYVFVGYAHEDANAVYPEMKWLHDQGFNVWYDEGISPGTVWRTELADSIMAAGLFLFFVTPRSVVSSNCEKEVNFAIDHDIPVLTVHLQETDLPSGIELTLSSIQGILKHDLPDHDYREKLLSGVSDHMQRGISESPPVQSNRYRNIAIVTASAVALLFAANALMKNLPLVSQSNESKDNVSLRRFTIDLPKSMQFTTMGYRPVIISADGQRVIFNATIEGRTQLYSRSLDSLDVLPIKGTENATSDATISPDGAWIAFVDHTDRMLKKVPVSGGVPVELCDVDLLTGRKTIAWGTNGRIVFANSSYNGLMQVSSSGGTPEPLTFPENGEVHKHPAFLPDGITLLFTVGERGTTTRQSDRVAALSLESGEQKILMAGASPQATSGGHLIYYKNNALWAVAFDADRLEVKSESVAVAENVRYIWKAYYSVSDDGTLVYVLQSKFTKRSLVWVDRHGNEEVISIDPRPFIAPRVSPSGDQISVTIDDPSGSDLWLYSLTRGGSTRITYTESRETAAVWSPDGRYIYYGSNLVDDIFRAATDGTGIPEQLTDTATHQWPNSITPDGRQLIYDEFGTATKKDLAVLVLSDQPTSEYLLQTEFNERNGQVSPDGLWLAYESDRSGQTEIYVRPYPDIKSAVWQISSRGGRKPFWAKTGKEIFYWGPTDMMTVAIETQPEFVSGLPEALFDHQDKYALTNIPHFHVDPAGGRFIMVKKPSDESTLTDRIIVVQNWLDEVTQKVGAN